MFISNFPGKKTRPSYNPSISIFNLRFMLKDPRVAVLKSALPLLSYSLGVQNDRVNLQRFARVWLHRLADMRKAQIRDGPKYFPSAVEFRFEETIARGTDETMKQIIQVLERAGLGTDEVSLRPVREFMERDRIGKAGGSRKKFKYDLADFGLTEEDVR